MADLSKAAQKWQNAVSAAGQSWLSGIQGVTVAPSQQAIAQQNKMVQNWTAAVNSGRWANSLGAVTLERWKSQTAAAGAAKYSAGAQKGAPKLANYFSAAASVYQQAHALRSSNMGPMERINANLALMASLKGTNKKAGY